MPRHRRSRVSLSTEDIVEVLEKETANDISKKLSNYISAARMIPMRLDIWEHLQRVFYAGIGQDADNTNYTLREKELYAQILEKIPQYGPLMDSFEGHPIAFEKFVDVISKSARDSRTSDTNRVKEHILEFVKVDPRLKTYLESGQHTAVNRLTPKGQRGWNNPQCSLLLLPPRQVPTFLEDPDTCMLRVRNGQEKVYHSEFPSFLYNKPPPPDPMKALWGLLRSNILVSMFRCVFTSPSSTVDKHSKGNARTQAEIHGITEVEPWGIVYVAVLCRLGLSATCWTEKDLHFSYKEFTEKLLKLFKDPENRWAKETLEWWNMQVCFRKSGASAGTDEDSSSKNEHAIPIDDLLEAAAHYAQEDENGNMSMGPSRTPSPGPMQPQHGSSTPEAPTQPSHQPHQPTPPPLPLQALPQPTPLPRQPTPPPRQPTPLPRQPTPPPRRPTPPPRRPTPRPHQPTPLPPSLQALPQPRQLTPLPQSPLTSAPPSPELMPTGTKRSRTQAAGNSGTAQPSQPRPPTKKQKKNKK